MTIIEINAEIRATGKKMKAEGIRRVSCFNAGLTSEEYRLNSQMFALETELNRAKKESRKECCSKYGEQK